MEEVLILPDTEIELKALPAGERQAILRVFLKLENLGNLLNYPHQSSVRVTEGLRELRPRAGRSRYRTFYRRTGPDQFVIAAIGPEALVDRKDLDEA